MKYSGLKQQKTTQAVRSILLLAGVSLAFSTPISAAEISADEKENERIVVTGSRIERTSAQMTTPTTIIDSAAIEMSGIKNIGDLLNRYPALLDGIGGAANNDNGTGTIAQAGLELANLRGLGTNRTLVLVNGRRHVPGSAGTSSVDMSMIPASLIERVEIITGGASAIYGADAVTGVINVILKSNFEGTQIDLSAGITDESDGETQDIGLTWGTNFANGNGNLTAHLAYSNEEEIPMASRPYAVLNPGFQSNPLNTGPNDGIANTIFFQDVRFQALSEEGLFYLPNSNYLFGNLPITQVSSIVGPPVFADDPFGLGYDTYTIDRDTGNLRDFIPGANCQIVPCDGGDGFRTQETNTLNSPSERVIFSLNGHYDINPTLRLTSDFKYAKVESAASGQASVFHDDNFGPLITITNENPFRPQELVDLMDARSLEVAALAVVGLSNRSVNTRETIQFSFGGSGSWDTTGYDFYIQQGQVEEEMVRGDLFNARYYEALDAVTGSDGTPVCRSGNANCVAYNPIDNLASQAAIDYVSVDLVDTSKIEQTIVSFGVNGDVFNVPSGTVEYAAGIEYRKESSESNPDPLTQAREPNGLGSGLVGSTTGPSPELNSFVSSVKGDYDVAEIYGEAIIPLLVDLTAIDSLDLELAARYSDHSITGGDTTYKSALNWTANDIIRTRLTYSKAVRAPNISELFAPQQTSATFVTDPCHIDNLGLGSNPANRQANCEALGMPAGFQSAAAFGTRNTLLSGNQDLSPEEADTFTLGIVITPNNNFNLAIDYWDIEITNAITNQNPDDLLASCVDGATLNQSACNLVQRSNLFQINSIGIKSINAAKFNARGTDLDLSYLWELNEAQLRLSFQGTYLDERKFQLNQNDPSDIDSRAGQVGTPHFRALINTSYMTDLYSINWSINYIGKSSFDKDATAEAFPDWFDNTVDAVAYHNLYFGYNFSENISAHIGINNIADKEPENLPGLNSGGLLYDGIGRRYYAGVKISL